jgi:sortase A
MKTMPKTIAKILIGIGLISGFLVLGRSLFYSPTGEASDSGLVANTAVTVQPDGSLPSRLLIPKIDVDTEVQHLGVTASGNMAAPSNFTDVSWYKFGAVPGAKGSAVMAGHEDNALSLDGVFKHLGDLAIGDSVFVVDEGGNRLEFKVVEKAIYEYDNSPTERIFNKSDKARLNLITCAGDWLPEAKTNDKRLVIYTELVTR